MLERKSKNLNQILSPLSYYDLGPLSSSVSLCGTLSFHKWGKKMGKRLTVRGRLDIGKIGVDKKRPFVLGATNATARF